MHLSKSGRTYVLKCHCGHYNLSFRDHGSEPTGTVTCLMCGATAEWRDLLAGTGLQKAPEPLAPAHVLEP
jgi:hypothetical protein